jgi:hypothetical protein
MRTLIILVLSLGLVLPAAAQVEAVQGRNAKPVYKVELEKVRDEFKKAVEVKRAEVDNFVKEKRDELKTKLQNIKDERKKEAVNKIGESIVNLNTKMTTHYSNVLNQISDVLSRVVSRADKAQANGKDVATARTAVSKAQSDIAAAQAAVVAQTGKSYTLNISTDAKLKADVGEARKVLHNDLKKVEDLVKTARNSVRLAVVELAKIQGVDKLENATSTKATSIEQ